MFFTWLLWMPSSEFLEQTNIIATNFLLVDWANKHLIKNNQITPRLQIGGRAEVPHSDSIIYNVY